MQAKLNLQSEKKTKMSGLLIAACYNATLLCDVFYVTKTSAVVGLGAVAITAFSAGGYKLTAFF
jgi:hypothetical protein